jgi:hypothetical protein
MELRQARRLTYRDGRPRKFYGCPNWPACTGTHGAHPDGKPLGTPADDVTKAARIRAHEVFDRLWKGDAAAMSRADAYRLLARLMGRDEVHFGAFAAAECEEAIRVLAALSSAPALPAGEGEAR